MDIDLNGVFIWGINKKIKGLVEEYFYSFVFGWKFMLVLVIIL